jgi:hypothetical protein
MDKTRRAAPEGGDGFMDKARMRAFTGPVSPARFCTPST